MFTSQTPYPICRHIKTDGRRCQSPARSTSAFCHFNGRRRHTRPATIDVGPALSRNVLHPLPSHGAIQRALGSVFSGLTSGQLPNKKAGQMLHAIQLAMSELKKRGQ